MFEFYKYRKGDEGALYASEDISALSGYPMYYGAALKLTGDTLCYAETADTVYAISLVSMASSVTTATMKPKHIKVNSNQVWRATIGSAITAAFVVGAKGNLNIATAFGTAVDGNNAAGTAFWIESISTGSSPSTSACYVVFPDPADK